MNKIVIIILSTLILFPFRVSGNEDETQSELRLNPEIEESADNISIDYTDYPFVKLHNNKISLNGADWSQLIEKYHNALSGQGRFNVVYLGDSHIQADFGGNVVRQRLAPKEHSKGRGIIIPYRLAGTNQPNDYAIEMTGDYLSSKLMRTPWTTEMPFTGIGIQPQSRRFTLGFHSDSKTGRIRLHSRGSNPKPVSVLADSITTEFISYIDRDGLTTIDIEQPATHFRIEFDGDEQTVIGGIELINDSVGVTVHSIGNNGATYSAYATTDRFGSGLSALAPDLVVIALGTNEAFGRISASTLQNNIDVLVGTINSHCPDVKILLVGPTECYKRVYRRNKGRRRYSTTVLNTKTSEMAKAIRLYAEKEGIAYYNHYAVAGRALQMKNAHILSRDGVHFTKQGYTLWGNLLSDALLYVLGPNKE